MRQVLYTGLLCLASCSAFSQIEGTFSVCGDNSQDKLIYVAGGVFFFPIVDAENIPDSMLNYCFGQQRTYRLNGMELTEEHFLSLKLKPKYIAGNHGYYYFQYSTNKCIIGIVMFVDVTLPIVLNGVDLSDDQEAILKKVQSEKILSINRKGSLFGGGKIYIKTKSKKQFK